MNTLVAYFSAEGTTKRVAEEFGKEIGADIFEIDVFRESCLRL